MMLCFVILTLLSPSGYYNVFRRSQGEYTVYFWQEATYNFNDSLESWSNWEALKWQKPKCGCVLVERWIINCLWCKEWAGPIMIFMASIESVKSIFKWQMLKQCKLVQFDKALFWFMAVCSEGKFVTETMVIKKDKSLYDEMELTEKCMLTEDWLQNLDIAWYSIIFDNLAHNLGIKALQDLWFRQWCYEQVYWSVMMWWLIDSHWYFWGE